MRLRRPTKSSRSPRRASSTTATATKASGPAATSRLDFASLSDLFSAFFGEDIFGRTAGSRASRGADVLAEVEIELVEAAQGTVQTIPFPAAVACSTCDGSGAAPGTAPETCPACGGAGRLQAVSSSVFGQFVRTQTCPTCAGSGRVAPDAVCRLRRRRAGDRGAHARGRDPRGDPRRPADPALGRRPRGRARRPRGRRLRPRPRRARRALRPRRKRHRLQRRA